MDDSPQKRIEKHNSITNGHYINTTKNSPYYTTNNTWCFDLRSFHRDAYDVIEGLNKDILDMRQNHSKLCRGIKKILGLKNWPDIEGNFQDGIIKLLNAHVEKQND